MAGSKYRADINSIRDWCIRHLYRMWSWFSDEIRAMLPATVIELLSRHEQSVVTSIHDNAAHVRLQSGAVTRDIALLDLNTDSNEAATHASSAVIRSVVGSITPSILELDEAQVLRREVSLPAETEERLADVIGFEMDRLTPFHHDQVYFDFRITQRDKVSRSIKIELIVAPRKIVDGVLSHLASVGIKPSVISVAETSEPPSHKFLAEETFNLLPRDQRARPGRRERLLPRVLVFCTIVLAGIAIYLPFHQRNSLMEKLDSAVAELKIAATEATDTRNEIDSEIRRGNYLFTKRNEMPTILQMLDELTLILPDDTWISRLEVFGTRMQFQGESDDASSLIALIEGAENFKNAQFSSSVSNNPRTGQDQFALEAELNLGLPDSTDSL